MTKPVATWLAEDPDFDKLRPIASAWIYRRAKQGIEQYPLTETNPDAIERWRKEIAGANVPRTVPEKKDRLLLAFAEDVEALHGTLDRSLAVEQHKYKAEIAARLMSEVNSVANYLKEDGLVLLNSRKTTEVRSDGGKHTRPEFLFSITSRGWDAVEALRRTSGRDDTAFVALWFAPVTEHYRAAVRAGIRAAGYNAVIVDETEFNDYIMDRVIADIREATFIVADFTCCPEDEARAAAKIKGGVRGGVYFEAGFARGLGKEVIHTCRDDPESRRRLHFDVDQIKTIFWAEDDLARLGTHRSGDNTQQCEFSEKLRARILATVGRGPVPPESQARLSG